LRLAKENWGSEMREKSKREWRWRLARRRRRRRRRRRWWVMEVVVVKTGRGLMIKKWKLRWVMVVVIVVVKTGRRVMIEKWRLRWVMVVVVVVLTLLLSPYTRWWKKKKCLRNFLKTPTRLRVKLGNRILRAATTLIHRLVACVKVMFEVRVCVQTNVGKPLPKLSW
jgi:hypothetical protein